MISDSFENYLDKVLKEIEEDDNNQTIQAMRYSLTACGKRIRPRLLCAIANNYGADYQEILATCAALEMIHTYSLIHDDLPLMDDDSLRRGKPACHIRFDETTALLAGDGLLTLAFEMISRLNDDHCKKILKIISEAAGISGQYAMIYGQDLDINQNIGNYADYSWLAANKTGALFGAALACGAVLSDRDDLVEDLTHIGGQLGVVFQLQDDLLEIESDEMTSGKSFSDTRNEKRTAVAILGKEGTKNILVEEYGQLKENIANLPREFPVLDEIITNLVGRVN